MKTFLAVYTGSNAAVERSGWNQLSATERSAREAQGFEAWITWSPKHPDAIVQPGAPLGKTKRVTAAGISDTSNELAGFVVVRAESHEAAAELFERHPHFSMFPGEGVEIMECLPMPTRGRE